jgi:hypothetical protein
LFRISRFHNKDLRKAENVEFWKIITYSPFEITQRSTDEGAEGSYLVLKTLPSRSKKSPRELQD